MTVAAQTSGTGSRVDQLAEHVASISYEALAEEVVDRSKQVTLDCLGAICSGATLHPRLVLEGFAQEVARERGPCTLVGSDLRADPIVAAFANSIAAHADETDDAHYATLTHPSMVVVPVAVALGEAHRLSGRQMIAAVVAGYDVQCRVALALGPRAMMTRGFMPLAVCANFGAVAAASVLLGLDRGQARHALGLAGLQAGGLWACAEDGTHMAKALMGGAPVRNGLTAAMLAKVGYHGPPDIFEGRDGLLPAFSPTPQPELLTEALGERFEVMRTSLKKHACGGPIQGSVDGLLEIMAAERLNAGDIARIRVEIAPSGRKIVDDRSDPPINLQYVLAVAAFDGVVGVVQTHSPSRLENTEVLDLQRRIELRGNEEFEKVWPGRRPAMVEVETAAGAVHSVLVEYPRGSPDRPLTWDEVNAKFSNLCGDWDGADRVAEQVRELEDVQDLGELLEPLQRRAS